MTTLSPSGLTASTQDDTRSARVVRAARPRRPRRPWLARLARAVHALGDRLDRLAGWPAAPEPADRDEPEAPGGGRATPGRTGPAPSATALPAPTSAQAPESRPVDGPAASRSIAGAAEAADAADAADAAPVAAAQDSEIGTSSPVRPLRPAAIRGPRVVRVEAADDAVPTPPAASDATAAATAEPAATPTAAAPTASEPVRTERLEIAGQTVEVAVPAVDPAEAVWDRRESTEAAVDGSADADTAALDGPAFVESLPDEHPLARLDETLAAAERAAELCDTAARLGFHAALAAAEGPHATTPMPAALRPSLDEADFRLAAHLYRNAATAVRIAGRISRRDYLVENIPWALGLGGRAAGQLADFLADRAGGGHCPIQDDVRELLLTVARSCKVHRVEGLRKGQRVGHRGWNGVRDGLEKASEGVSRAERKREELANRLEYHLDKLRDPDEDAAHHLRRIDETAADLMARGLGPDAGELSPLAELVAEAAYDATEHATIARIAGHASDAACTASSADAADEACIEAELVTQARELLRDRTMMIVCGIPKPEVEERIRETFDLADVQWVDHPKGASYRRLEAPALRSDIVVIGNRFMSHEVSEELPKLCRRHGIPVAKVGNGYSQVQIARAVVEQASRRLGRG